MRNSIYRITPANEIKFIPSQLEALYFSLNDIRFAPQPKKIRFEDQLGEL
jgi:hypothetical protein